MSPTESPMIKDARDRVKKNPDSFESQGLLGELLYQAGKYSEALQPLELAATYLQKELETKSMKIGMFSPEMAEKILCSFYMMRGDSLLNLNQPEQARGAFDGALRVKKDDADIWNSMGVAQANSGNPDDALNSFLQAVRLGAGRVDLWENLQKCYKNLGRYEAKKINPVLGGPIDIELNWGILAELYLSAGKYDETQAIIDQILEWNPKDVRGLLSQARMKMLDGAIDDSSEILQKILSIEDNNLDALWHLCRAHCILGNRKECMNLLDTILKIDSTHLNALILQTLLKSHHPGTTQTFGMLTIENYAVEFSDGDTSGVDQLVAYKMFPGLRLPLGSTVEDVVHTFVKGKIDRFSSEEYLKSVEIHTGANDLRIQVNAVPSHATFFRYIQPGSLNVRFMEHGSQRGRNPASNRDDLVVGGDVILLTSPMSMVENLRLATLYPIIKNQTEQKLANWPYRF